MQLSYLVPSISSALSQLFFRVIAWILVQIRATLASASHNVLEEEIHQDEDCLDNVKIWAFVQLASLKSRNHKTVDSILCKVM